MPAEHWERASNEVAALAVAISGFEPVRLYARPSDTDEARSKISQALKQSQGNVNNISVIPFPINHLWVRDFGPIYVRAADKADRKSRFAINFTFTEWGHKNGVANDAEGPEWPEMRPRQLKENVDFASKVIQSDTVPSPVTRIDSKIALEGGAIVVDGQGTLLATESSILNDNRNPGVSKSEVETELHTLLGAKKVIWFPGKPGLDLTDVHVDAEVNFIRPGVVVLSRPHSGRQFEIHVVDEPDPKSLEHFANEDPATNYVNFYFVNGGVILPQFGDTQRDREAMELFQKLCPDRVVRPVHVRALPPNGGVVHCATQQVIDLESEDEFGLPIVFVHGLNGNQERTWTGSGITEPWPATLLPLEIPTARILTFGYDASAIDYRSFVSASRIRNHAWNLLTSLAAHREKDDTDSRPIIFICHSLGGLVCEDALVISRDRRETHLQSISHHTCGIVFLGTPHRGSGLAKWAKLMSQSLGILKETNTDIVRVLERDSEVLARLQDSFHTMVMERRQDGLALQITCFYEELPMPRFGLIVPPESAILPGYIPIGIHAHHSNMTKFSNSEDPGFIAISSELRRWVKEIARKQESHPSSAPKTNPVAPDANHGDKGHDDSTATFIVPYSCNPDFVGRLEVLEKLKVQLGHCNEKENSYLRTSLFGLGGVGKTQIALAYVYWLQEACPAISVLWVHASNAERFRQSYMSIAEENRIPGYDDPKVDLLQLVKEWLERKDQGNWLMVLDNADDMNLFYGSSTAYNSTALKQTDGLWRYLPESRHGSLIATTRDKQLGVRLTKGQHLVEIALMSEAESKQLLLAKLRGISATSQELLLLSSHLDHLPLALAQAAAFIQETCITVTRYL
ncbi:Agmatine deiminase [Paramyrothecium foliicola]|nr:Agmatine deiminase [Paramyrothecium foliicola]